ncbi:MAG: hypothetical protein L7U87_09030 [Chlamydiales bacterium]|nr:hypothetical protein [Chlamydiales bacterium]
MRLYYALAFLISLCLLLTHHQNYLFTILDNMGRSHLLLEDYSFLNESREESTEVFAVLTAIKSGLSLVESSSAGISFIVDVELQVGRIASAILDMVNYAWSASFISLGAISAIEIFLHLLEKLNHPIMYFSLVLLSLYFFAQLIGLKQKEHLLRITKVAFFFLILFYVCAPLSVCLGAKASKAITRPISVNVKKQLKGHAKNYEIKNQSDDLKDRSQEAIDHFVKHSKNLENAHHSLAQLLIDHLILLLFDLFIFPILFLSFLYLGAKKIILSN